MRISDWSSDVCSSDLVQHRRCGDRQDAARKNLGMAQHLRHRSAGVAHPMAAIVVRPEDARRILFEVPITGMAIGKQARVRNIVELKARRTRRGMLLGHVPLLLSSAERRVGKEVCNTCSTRW